jgi:hypothetical protein
VLGLQHRRSNDNECGHPTVDPQLLAQIRTRPGGPRRLPRRRPRRTHRWQVLGIDPVQHPPRRRHRSHLTEHLLPVGEHRDTTDRIHAIGDRDRQIAQHP